MIEYKVATLEDIEATLKLHSKYQVDTIKPEDKADGFVTTPFSKEELTDLIEQESGLFIAKVDEEVVAYVMSASWQFWSRWPMFAFMVNDLLPHQSYNAEPLTVDNSYQYGPIAIDKAYRGSEVLERIFNFALSHMAKRYDYLVTFVNKINPRSFNAHHKKLGLDIIEEFEYNSNFYWELGCKTRR
jgi:hypothetical protein